MHLFVYIADQVQWMLQTRILKRGCVQLGTAKYSCAIRMTSFAFFMTVNGLYQLRARNVQHPVYKEVKKQKDKPISRYI